MQGKRGCALKLAFLLHVAGFAALVLGCITPFWSAVLNEDGDTQLHEGLLVFYTPTDDSWTFRDFNTLKSASSDEGVLYLTLSISFGLLAIFVELFLVEAFALVLYNASCGRRYSPDYLTFFSLISGLIAVTSLVLYEQYTGRGFNDTTNVIELDYSRGFVIIFIATVFLSTFFTVCDRTAGGKQ